LHSLDTTIRFWAIGKRFENNPPDLACALLISGRQTRPAETQPAMMNTSLTGLMAASKDLNVISNNLANASTTGFKRSMAQFQDVMGASLGNVKLGAGAVVGEVTRITQQGPMVTTNASLDLAITGGGYFVYGDTTSASPTRATAGTETVNSYSRAGQLTLNKDGYLVDPSGAPLLGYKALAGNVFSGTASPINVFAALGGDPTQMQSLSVSQSGVISATKADGTMVKVASVAMANFRNENGLQERGGNKLVATEGSGAAEMGFAGKDGLGQVQQGVLESTNVDITTELMHMVTAQQAYNGNSRALQTTSEMIRSAIETIAHG
jgi:flagellar hook protein FlgE